MKLKLQIKRQEIMYKKNSACFYFFCHFFIQLSSIFHTRTFLGQRVGSYLNLTKLFLWQIPCNKVSRVLQVKVIRSAFKVW